MWSRRLHLAWGRISGKPPHLNAAALESMVFLDFDSPAALGGLCFSTFKQLVSAGGMPDLTPSRLKIRKSRKEVDANTHERRINAPCCPDDYAPSCPNGQSSGQAGNPFQNVPIHHVTAKSLKSLHLSTLNQGVRSSWGTYHHPSVTYSADASHTGPFCGYPCGGHRSFASQARAKRGNNKPPSKSKKELASTASTASNESLPIFEDCLRQFARLVDALEAKAGLVDHGEEFDRMLATNAASSEKLLAFLDSITPQARGYPKAASNTLDFYVVEGASLRKVQLKFRTTGGDCKRQVREDFERFFSECGVAQSFRWSTGSWGALHIHGGEGEQELREKARLIKRSHTERHGDSPGQNADVSATTLDSTVKVVDASSGQEELHSESFHAVSDTPGCEHADLTVPAPSANERESGKEGVLEIMSREDYRYGEHGSIFSTRKASASGNQEAEEGAMSIEALIGALDPALQLIAEFAWGDQDEKTRQGVLEMLESFKRSSPLLGEAISEKIWKGRLGLTDVCEGLQQRDVAIATSIVYHVRRIVEKKGRPW